MSIVFRPHHFLCAFCFQGKGYSASFIANFTVIMSRLQAKGGDAEVIQIVAQTDSICAPCPHRRQTLCETEAKIAVLDSAHSAALNISPGDTLTWGDAKARIKEKISLPVFHRICETCSWKPYQICENIIKKSELSSMSSL